MATKVKPTIYNQEEKATMYTQEDVDKRAKDLYEQKFRELGGAALSGPGTGVLNVSGTEEARQGALEGLQFGQMLYGQGIQDVGKEAADYGQMVKGRLNQDSVSSDLYRQNANRRLAQSANKMGMAGATMGGAQEQLRRQAEFNAQAMNQEYKDKALALYGKNISAKQQGLATQYQAGKGTGVASTKIDVPNTGGTIICTELLKQGKISLTEQKRASVFGYKIHPYTYIGYLTIATPIVQLMQKSDKFSNLFVGWAKSIAKQKPNLITRLMMPICFMVGYARQIKKEKIA